MFFLYILTKERRYPQGLLVDAELSYLQLSVLSRHGHKFHPHASPGYRALVLQTACLAKVAPGRRGCPAVYGT